MSLDPEKRDLLANQMRSLGAMFVQNRLKEMNVPIENSMLHFRFSVMHNHAFDRKIPGILLVTLPKSGSIYLLNALYFGLKIESVTISGGHYFPNDHITLKDFKMLATGNRIAQTHIPASRINLNFIGNYFDKLVVHLRDPRQALLSWAHFIDRFEEKQKKELALSHEPAFPESFFKKSFEARLDWLIHNALIHMINWIEGWIDAEESSSFKSKILFTQQKDLKEDSDSLINEILSFYGINSEFFQRKKREVKEGQLHYRKGSVDEWREVFTKEQIQYVNNLMPKRQLEKFGW